MSVTSHHLLYDRASWESQLHTRIIRQEPGLIFPLEEDYHNILHQEVVTIPLLDRYTAGRVRSELRGNLTGRYSRNIPILLHAIEDAINRPKSSTLQKQIGALTIHAIEQTIPYIHMGLTTDTVGGRDGI